MNFPGVRGRFFYGSRQCRDAALSMTRTALIGRCPALNSVTFADGTVKAA
jgi:hypothetical protein